MEMVTVEMIEGISGDEIFSEILILRNVENKTYLIVEGSSDCSTLDAHISAEVCETIPAYSKEAVIRAVELSDEQSVPNVAGLVDRDWIGFGEIAPESSNVFTTDKYDLEATIFFTPTIVDRFFAAQSEKSIRSTFMSMSGRGSMLGLLAHLALPVGLLRFISYKDGYELAMRHFPAHVALSPDLMDMNLTALIETACGRTKPSPDVTEAELLSALSEAIIATDDAADYCSGHDMACCLMFILAKKFGKTMRIDVLLGSIRAMVSMADLREMKFFSLLDDWATQHQTVIWKAS
jgi:hypothetical protein